MIVQRVFSDKKSSQPALLLSCCRLRNCRSLPDHLTSRFVEKCLYLVFPDSII